MKEYDIKIVCFDELIELYSEEWTYLFDKCFKSGISKARNIFFNKYQNNKGKVALCFKNGKLCASYSVIFDNLGRPICLSVDTMSDGSIRLATVKIANVLYDHLKHSGFTLILGFPNKKITNLRKRFLGWVTVESYYLGIKWKSLTKNEVTDFQMNRPDSFLFNSTIITRGIIKIMTISGFEITLTNKKKYFFTFAKKNLYCKILLDDKNTDAKNFKLNSYSIDVP